MNPFGPFVPLEDVADARRFHEERGIAIGFAVVAAIVGMAAWLMWPNGDGAVRVGRLVTGGGGGGKPLPEDEAPPTMHERASRPPATPLC